MGYVRREKYGDYTSSFPKKSAVEKKEENRVSSLILKMQQVNFSRAQVSKCKKEKTKRICLLGAIMSVSSRVEEMIGNLPFELFNIYVERERDVNFMSWLHISHHAYIFAVFIYYLFICYSTVAYNNYTKNFCLFILDAFQKKKEP